MKRYFIRCMGTILSAFTAFLTTDRAESGPHFDYNKTFTLENDLYTVTVYTGAAWYVGWRNINNSSATTIPDAYDKIWPNEWMDLKYEQPMVADFNATSELFSGAYTGVLVSHRTFRVREVDDVLVTRFADGGKKQKILYESTWVTDLGDLAYSPDASVFIDARCCYYSPIQNTQGSYGFSYSGDGRGRDVCPCFYTTADKVYTGNSCASYNGVSSCTGTSVGAAGSGQVVVGDSTSENWPAVIRNVAFCYKFNSCIDKARMYRTRDFGSYTGGFSGCHMVRVPIIGALYGSYNDLLLSTTKVGGFTTFEPKLTQKMDCVTFDNDDLFWMSCASGTTSLSYLTQDGNDGCYPCPDVAGTVVGGYALGNTSFYVEENRYGIDSCRFTKPVSSDESGTFELTDSNGTSQTCYAY